MSCFFTMELDFYFLAGSLEHVEIATVFISIRKMVRCLQKPQQHTPLSMRCGSKVFQARTIVALRFNQQIKIEQFQVVFVKSRGEYFKHCQINASKYVEDTKIFN